MGFTFTDYDLKMLDKIIRLCRKRGVDSIEVDGVKLELGTSPAKRQSSSEQAVNPSDTFRELSAEEQLFWSAQPPPIPEGKQ